MIILLQNGFLPKVGIQNWAAISETTVVFFLFFTLLEALIFEDVIDAEHV